MARKYYIDTDELRFVQSATSSASLLPSEFFNGDDADASFYFLARTGIAGAPYRFLDKSAASLKVGIGPVRPVLTGGTFTITFGANTTTALAYSATAAQVSTALNLLASIIAAGGVTVTRAANSARFRIMFTADGSRAAFTVDTAELIPDASPVVSERIAGTASVQEVQEILLAPDPVAFQSVFTDLPTSVTATVTTPTGGSASASEVQKIAWSTNPTAGTFSITMPSDTRSVTSAVVAGIFTTTTNHGFAVGQPVVMTGFTAEANFTEGTTYYVAAVPSPTTFTIAATSGGAAITTATADAGAGTVTTPAQTTAEIAGLASFTTVETALEALSVIGDGNITISGIVGEYYLLSYTGEKANANFPAVTVTTSALIPPYGKTGELNLSTFGVQDLLDATDADSIPLRLEVELTESGTVQTYAADCDVLEDVIKSGAMAPTPIPSPFVNLHAYSTYSTSSAETVELTKTAEETKVETLKLTIAAGAGIYTTALELDTADCSAGDIWRIRCIFPPSANPTITVYSDTASPVLLYTITGTGAGFTQLLQFTFNGTSWESDQ